MLKEYVEQNPRNYGETESVSWMERFLLMLRDDTGR